MEMNTEVIETKKEGLMTKVKRNWKPIAVVTVAAIGGTVFGYKIGYNVGLGLADVAEDVVDEVTVTSF